MELKNNILFISVITIFMCLSRPSYPEEVKYEGMVYIPAGEFIMGTDKTKEKEIPPAYGLKKPPYEDEKPMRKVFLKAFYIDKYEVTHAQYRKFVGATRHPWPDYWKEGYNPAWDNYPIFNVSWEDGNAYCQWIGKRLPTEQEWEKAARGTDGRRFPWGNEYDSNNANTLQKGITPVGFFKLDVSPYGVYDLGGNLIEWVANWYRPYPGNKDQDLDFEGHYKVMRGGSWGGVGHYNLSYYIRAACRKYAKPEGRFNDVGFRCAKDP